MKYDTNSIFGGIKKWQKKPYLQNWEQSKECLKIWNINESQTNKWIDFSIESTPLEWWLESANITEQFDKFNTWAIKQHKKVIQNKDNTTFCLLGPNQLYDNYFRTIQHILPLAVLPDDFNEKRDSSFLKLNDFNTILE